MLATACSRNQPHTFIKLNAFLLEECMILPATSGKHRASNKFAKSALDGSD
jgi:hypothetical protein